MKTRLIGPMVFLLAAAQVLVAQSSTLACERLNHVPKLNRLSVTATMNPSGTMPSRIPGIAPAVIPEHCRVVAIVEPVPDSRIQVEVWIPTAIAWNGKLLATGNGGYSSELSLGEMADGLRRGYSVAGSDTGHQGGDLSFGVGHPEKIRDWAYRATHVMAEAAKQIVTTFYDRPIEHAYFTGCSTGGQQALSEAQRYPNDFDGIIAGDPGYDRISLNSMFVWSWLLTHPAGQPDLSATKLPLIANAATESCASDKGAISDPQSCHPNLQALQCKKDRQDGCLTGPEIRQVQQLYDGPHDAQGHQLYPGWPPGSERGWGLYFVGRKEPARLEFWREWVFDDPQWDPRSFKFERDRDEASAKLPYLDATSPDLRAFRKRAGKLILYHGLADPVVPPQDSFNYYTRVAQNLASSPRDFFRFFPVPGMYHCGGGPMVNSFNPLEALEAWVEHGQPPDEILGVHKSPGQPDAAIPIRAYP